MNVVVKAYDTSKYERSSNKIGEVEYDITGYEVKEIPKEIILKEKEIPKEIILKETDESCVDPYNEYLIVHFENGETSMFRNSCTELFRK